MSTASDIEAVKASMEAEFRLLSKQQNDLEGLKSALSENFNQLLILSNVNMGLTPQQEQEKKICEEKAKELLQKEEEYQRRESELRKRASEIQEIEENQKNKQLGNSSNIISTNCSPSDIFDLDLQMVGAQGPEIAHMICCNCGAVMEPNAAKMCLNCLKSQIDITEGIPRNCVVHYCGDCDRYLKPPYVRVEKESQELLSLCLRKVKALNSHQSGIRLKDACFVWTEEHSRRIKIKITIQKEVLGGAIMQQSLPIEFIVAHKQCDDCKKTYTPHHWLAMVQVRQRSDHKRTLLFLEQIILKNNAHDRCINIVDRGEGMDFHFAKLSDSSKFVDFVRHYFPVKVGSASKQLVSHNVRDSTYHNKTSICVELCPVCRDDLVFLPQKVASQFGGVPSLLLCRKISTAVYLIDPLTLRGVDIASEKFWKHEFSPLLTKKHLVEFVVLNIEDVDAMDVNSAATAKRFLAAHCTDQEKSTISKAWGGAVYYKLVDVEVARTKDLGVNDSRMVVRSHLGLVLHIGDLVMGYDFASCNIQDHDAELNLSLEKYPQGAILVRPVKQTSSKSSAEREWVLKKLGKEMSGKPIPQEEVEEFKNELEENADMRNEVDLWKNPKKSIAEKRKDKNAQKNVTEICEILEGLTLDDEIM